MNNEDYPLTWKEIVYEKSKQFYAWTVILALLFNYLANKWLNYRGNLNNDTIFTYNYSLGAIGFIFLIPAAILSVLIIKGIHGTKTSFLRSPFADVWFIKTFRHDGVGFIVMGTLFKALGWIIKILWKIVTYPLVRLGSSFTTFVFGSKGSSNGSSTSVSRNGNSGGYYPHPSNTSTSRTSTPSRVSSPSPPSGPSQLEEQFRERKRQEEAERQARDRQKEADFQSAQRRKEAVFALKKAADQASYNANTRYMNERINQANAKLREANEAEKKARNLRK